MNNKKSIILVLPESLGLSDLIAKNFEYHGFDVIYHSPKPYKYKNFNERITNLFRREIFKDKDYKNRQQEQELLAKLQYDITECDTEIDYALFIRPDIFSIDFIKQIKNQAKKTIGYQWDGLNRFPAVFDRIKMFDDFYVFDSKDITNYPDYKLKLSHNFFFDIDQNSVMTNNEESITLYFIGRHLIQRVAVINQFTKLADELGLKTNFLISLTSKEQKNKSLYASECINFIDKNITYSENLDNVKKSDVLIDFVNNVHSGLSFRVFESLFYQKKLITNNTDVMHYDFYHEDNIYVWDSDNFNIDALKNFLDKPYNILPLEVLDQYSFKSWYSSMLKVS